ncbi:MAG: nucleoside-diphosphate sugar epimerase, partial [Sphingobacterium sp.]
RFILKAENISNREILTRICLIMKKPAPHIKATPLLLSIAWRMARMVSIISGKKAAITAESARAATQKLQYDNSKIKKALNYQFKPLEETLQEVCETYYLQKTI